MQKIKYALMILATSSSAGFAQTTQPLSVIDWLRDAKPHFQDLGKTQEPSVADSVKIPQVTIAPLGQDTSPSTGLFSADILGLNSSVFEAMQTGEFEHRLNRISNRMPVAAAQLVQAVMLGEFAAPEQDSQSFLETRAKFLTKQGAVPQAFELVSNYVEVYPELFPLYLDLGLLLGLETLTCNVWEKTKYAGISLEYKVLCLARNNQWDAAATVLLTAEATQSIDPKDVNILATYLEPELIETNPDMDVPLSDTPLRFFLLRASGYPTGRKTSSMYYYPYLDGSEGWKSKIEAAEHLAQRGAISANLLLGVYLDVTPAASGGVWERVVAVQEFNQNIDTLDETEFSDLADSFVRSIPDAAISGMIASALGEKIRATKLTGTDLSPAGFYLWSQATQNADENFNWANIATYSSHDLLNIPENLRVALGEIFERPVPRQEPIEKLLSSFSYLANVADGDFSKFADNIQTLRSFGFEFQAKKIVVQTIHAAAER